MTEARPRGGPMVRALLLAMIAIVSTTTSFAATADPAWLPTFEQKLTASAPAALDFLRAQPDSIKESADFQWALARAHQANNQPEAAAMALVTYDILTRRHGRDVSGLRSWLAVHAEQLLR